MKYLDRLELKAPVEQAALRELRATYKVPKDYIDFLKTSNGALGYVGTTPLQLYSAEEIVEYNRIIDTESYAPGLVLFGSNLSGIDYAFDTSGDS
jgi:hypothetical protein